MDVEKSQLRRYKDLVIGKNSNLLFLKFEILMLLTNSLSGSLGLFLRKFAYRHLLASVGKGVAFGRNISIRHPKKILIHDFVVLDDLCVLDANSDEDFGIEIGPKNMIARNVQICAKGGRIKLGANIGIGSNCVIHSGQMNEIQIGDNVLIAPYVYIGGTRYHFDRLDIPISEQGRAPQGGVTIGDGAWIGAGTTIVDGIRIGSHAIVGAGAVITEDVADYSIVGGVPAKIISSRQHSDSIQN